MSESIPPDDEHDTALRWRWPLALFVLTVVSTFWIGASVYTDNHPFPAHVARAWRSFSIPTALGGTIAWLAHGWRYAVPLLGILLCHEFGHFVMARRHRVPSSLPMFIPVPMPPFGTMGAVIRMRGRIRTRKALLDIGAAGPLAGFVVAVPVTLLGLALSHVTALNPTQDTMQEGTSVLYALMKWLTKGSIPAGSDVMLHPTAVAGWAGLFVTMINLIPYGQLDGGHVAYAVFGTRHDRVVPYIAWVLVALGVATGVYWGRALSAQGLNPWEFGVGYTQGFNWFMFAGLITLMHRGSRGRHPPTEDTELDSTRRAVGIFTLALFVLLFMPVPLRYVPALRH